MFQVIVDVALRAEKVPASLIAALPVALALLLTVVFGFGTETWMISSQALWQHGASALAVVGSFDGLLAANGRRLSGPEAADYLR